MELSGLDCGMGSCIFKLVARSFGLRLERAKVGDLGREDHKTTYITG